MKKLKVYFDTNVIGYLDALDHPEKRADTLAMWEKVKQSEYDIVMSEVTFDELEDIPVPAKLDTLKSYVAEITYDRIDVNEEIIRMAEVIKHTGIIPLDKHHNDRLHLGCALVAEADVIVSWNFNHMVNITTIRGVKGVAMIEGYKPIDIITPTMLINKGET